MALINAFAELSEILTWSTGESVMNFQMFSPTYIIPVIVVTVACGQLVRRGGFLERMFVVVIPPDLSILPKKLSSKDQIILDMLSTPAHKNEAWVLTDPDHIDHPIVYASPGFCSLFGYERTELDGRALRDVLYGTDTSSVAIESVMKAAINEVESSICMVNYRKDGTSFNNQFFQAPLYTHDRSLAYFVSVHVPVDVCEPGQDDVNAGWIYTLGMRA
mmetsp:Transcript_17865/g.30066  ORF Transcript_17865/g.30066 Transcript_17865/m.30066 type:complete len:218 (-) Transcript_17865:295-948(-)